MPTPETHFNRCDRIRKFGLLKDDFELSNLTQIQTESFARFLQLDEDPRHRAEHGIEGILREVFPVKSYDEQFTLEYVKYELGKPRYTPVECRNSG